MRRRRRQRRSGLPEAAEEPSGSHTCGCPVGPVHDQAVEVEKLGPHVIGVLGQRFAPTLAEEQLVHEQPRPTFDAAVVCFAIGEDIGETSPAARPQGDECWVARGARLPARKWETSHVEVSEGDTLQAHTAVFFRSRPVVGCLQPSGFDEKPEALSRRVRPQGRQQCEGRGWPTFCG